MDNPISFWIAWGDSAPDGKRNTPQDSCSSGESVSGDVTVKKERHKLQDMID